MSLRRKFVLLLVTGVLFSACARGEETSPTTGLPYAMERNGGYRPVLVSIANDFTTPIPTGLSNADIVYEYIHYGHTSTRFLAVYNDQHPETIGPLGSTRYFGADIQREWDAPFVFFGGTVASDGEMVVDVPAYMDEMGVPESLRIDGSLREHGLSKREISMNLRHNVVFDLDTLANDQWPMDPETDAPYAPSLPEWTFDEDYPENTDETITSIAIDYAINGYSPSYQYNAENHVYERQHNGTPAVDLSTNETVAADNVIVQYMEIVYQDDRASNPQITATGEGKADIFIRGGHISGYWVREDLDAKTRYYDEAGNALSFAPGKTFIQIVSEDAEITY